MTHLVFDILAVCLALVSGIVIYRWRLDKDLEKTAENIDGGYFLFLSIGSVMGAYFLGTLNLVLSDIMMVGRSILGAFMGAILMVEMYKLGRGITGSTGYMYVVPFCICVCVGRIGCFLSGMDDQTYGVPTSLPWGWDFGDGVARHPVQLYEAISMFVLGSGVIALLKYRACFIVRYGFYICAGFYAFQRFFWEFLKPYADFAGGLNVFQYACLILFLYALAMIEKERRHDRRPA